MILLLAGCTNGPASDVYKHRAGLRVCADGPTVEGIDVSHWQSTIDWDAVAGDGIDYAFVRVSHGTGTLDTQFDRNWPEVRRVGLVRGVYQFFSAGDDPVAQADLLIDAIGGALEPGDFPPVLDVENQSQEGLPASVVIANMHTWLDRVESRLGVRPIIYTGKYFWQDNLMNPDFTGYPLWVAHYGVDCPNVPDAFDGWVFWQYSGSGSAAGITGAVDRDVFNGTMADLLALTGTAPVCGDGWCVGGESSETCPSDCPVCRSVPSLGREVDETEVCFERGGDPTYLREETAGWLDSLIWTHATDRADPSNYGVFHLTFDEAGRYRVEAYTDAAFAQSTRARYAITHAGTAEVFQIDQTAVDGWATLAEVDFAAGGDQSVRLDDNTGEAEATETQLVFDALRITRLDPPTSGDAGPAGSPDSGVGSGDGGVTPSYGLTGGCSVRASGRGVAPRGGSPWWCALALAVWLGRRRRSRSD